MAFESISPNMSLVLPGVGQTPGPTWATDLNNSLTLIDQHNHTSGYGVPIPSSGISINADLTLNNNNLIDIKSLRMAPQSILAGPSDLDCLFVNGVDLYYNDGLGNHVRITQSGGVAGSPGSISNLTSPASASYVSGNATFVWQSAANTPANMDNASVILRNLAANSFGLTLNPPAAMGADYDLTLPVLPASQKIMTLDASGNMAAPYVVDNVSIEIASNIIKTKNTNVTAVSADTTVTSANNVYLVDTTSGDIDITLPTAVGGSRLYTIKKVSVDANTVFLLTTSGQTIDGIASGVVRLSAINDSITVQSNGSNYAVTNKYLSPVEATAFLSGDVTITSATLVKVPFTGYNGRSIDFSANSLTIVYDGLYSVSGTLRYISNINPGFLILEIRINGTPQFGLTIPNSSSGAFDNFLSSSIARLPLSAGDVLSLYTYQSSIATTNLSGTYPYSNSLAVVRVATLGED